MNNVSVVPIPAFKDNYIWLMRNQRYAAVVDPGDASPVLNYLRREKLELAAILNTHHHADHVGGNAGLLREFPVPVYGPRNESIPNVTHPLAEGDRVSVPLLGLEFGVLDIPGHTAGHIAYYGANLLFCGDTLFACGCGKLFEGTAQQMYSSLEKLSNLPDATLVYCGHEYTLANIQFAKAADPQNAALLKREANVRELRERGMPTLPSDIRLEKATNPFLRCNNPEIVRNASRAAGRALNDPVSVFASIREWKNNFNI
ncbi:MAG TPA: hydroxyacylglutathione hydrolase [Burkholderiales bacterium]|nr:hydroxyacylglutathione hydrolase [Burkholderiales bacterium]